MNMRWTFKPKPEINKVKQLRQVLGVSELIAELLVQRGVETYEEAHRFFCPSLADLHDPYMMKDMDKAVNRIEQAIKNNEKILIFGDYDVDGTTAVSLVASYLKTLYPHIVTYIPDRYIEGYGISFKGIDFAEANDCSLIIALDCGIKAHDKIIYANQKNIDFIICDHHIPGKTLPEALAILDPKRVDCFYPYKDLCGCGIGFKLVQAIAAKRGVGTNDLISYLDLVATAIGADIVPINGENRILTYFGLQVLNTNPRLGLKALMRQENKNIFTIADVVFTIAPRINAAGRIKHGHYAVQLLTEFDWNQALVFATEIEQFNSNRKALDKHVTQEALYQIEQNNEQKRFSTVVFHENWHKGVLGIVASRLMETYYRPTLVFTKSGDKYVASARSVNDFDVYYAIESCSEYLEQFGGHKYAAGLTLHPKNYEAFKNKFEEVIRNTIDLRLLQPEISIDAEIQLEYITPKLIRILKRFAPFGPENMTPVFLTRNMIDTGYGKTLGNDEEHLSLFVKQYDSQGYLAIGFGLGKALSLTENRKHFQAVYSIEEKEWKGNSSVQLRFKDIKIENMI